MRQDQRRVALIITPRYPPLLGGMERECALLAGEFARRGYVPVVVTEQLGEDLPRDQVVDGVRVLRIPSSPHRSLIVQLRVAAAVARLVFAHRRSVAFAVIRTMTLPALLVGALKRLRLVQFPTLVTAEIGGDQDDVVALASRPLFALSRALVSSHDRLNGICAANVQHLHEHGFPPARISAIPNGIDTSAWERTKAPQRVRRLLFLGRLDPAKGLFELLDALAEVRERHVDATLTIAGSGPARGALESRARELGLDGSVRFAGLVPHAETGGLLEQSDALVLPSYSEGMPLSVLEAAAHRRVLILTDVGDARLLFARSAHFCRPRDAADLARAIQDAMTSAPATDHGDVVERVDLRSVAARILGELGVPEWA